MDLTKHRIFYYYGNQGNMNSVRLIDDYFVNLLMFILKIKYIEVGAITATTMVPQ